MVSESYEQGSAVMTKGEYVNKLHDIFHCHPRGLEAFVKSGVVNWPFDTKKVKLLASRNVYCHAMPADLPRRLGLRSEA